MEEHITFVADGLTLEGMLDLRSREKGVIVAHPHPLNGGEMGNPVVEAAVQAYARQSWTTLRFNFRGVGESEGNYGGGNAERADLLAAVKLLIDKGISTIELVGYSFGTWVIAHSTDLPNQVKGLVFIAPPVALMDFSAVQSLPKLRQVVVGEEDDIGPLDLVREALGRWHPQAKLSVIDDADHFFYGFLDEIEKAMGLDCPVCQGS